jgi:hypothetical protein
VFIDYLGSPEVGVKVDPLASIDILKDMQNYRISDAERLDYIVNADI